MMECIRRINAIYTVLGLELVSTVNHWLMYAWSNHVFLMIIFYFILVLVIRLFVVY